MDIQHIEYFLEVARLGSINKAARSLYISQPYLGKIIRDLENEIGVPLVQRTNRGIVLTVEGSEFYTRAERILNEFKEMRTISQNPPIRESSLEVSMTKFSYIMQSFIAVVCNHRNDPAFSHRITEGAPDDVVEDVYSGMSRIGVLNFDTCRRDRLIGEFKAKRLEYHRLANLQVHILVAENHPLLKENKPVNLQTLSDYGFVRDLGTHEDFTYRYLSEQSNFDLNKPSRTVYTNGRLTLLNMVGSSDFFGIGIHSFHNQESAYNVRSIPIEGCEGAMEFGYIIPANQPVSPITSEFIAELKKRVTNDG